jgi:cation transport ATPase
MIQEVTLPRQSAEPVDSLKLVQAVRVLVLALPAALYLSVPALVPRVLAAQALVAQVL